jgi:hypothetical protein
MEQPRLWSSKSDTLFALSRATRVWRKNQAIPSHTCQTRL